MLPTYDVYIAETSGDGLGAKFNNKRKTFNFANTLKQQKTMKKWIEDYPKHYPNK